MKPTNGIKEELVGLRRDMQELKADVKSMAETFQNFEAGRLTTLEVFVAKMAAEFSPVQKAVYGMIGVVLLAVLGALVMLVVK